MKLKIRRGQVKDLNQVYILGSRTEELKFSKKIRFHIKPEFVEWIKKPKTNIFLVADDSGKIVGFLYAKIIDRDWCMLDNLVVDNMHRNKGIGYEMLEQLYKILKKEKVDYMQTLVEANHKNSQKFWKGKGFNKGKTFVWYEKEI